MFVLQQKASQSGESSNIVFLGEEELLAEVETVLSSLRRQRRL